MAINKISFAYITIPYPGMVANPSSYLPMVAINNADPSMTYVAVISVGMLFDTKHPYAIEADILFEDESVIDNAEASNDRMTTPYFNEVEENQIVTLANLEIKGIKFKKSGMYKISCKLAKDLNSLRSKEFIDLLDSYFYVKVLSESLEQKNAAL